MPAQPPPNNTRLRSRMASPVGLGHPSLPPSEVPASLRSPPRSTLPARAGTSSHGPARNTVSPPRSTLPPLGFIPLRSPATSPRPLKRGSVTASRTPSSIASPKSACARSPPVSRLAMNRHPTPDTPKRTTAPLECSMARPGRGPPGSTTSPQRPHDLPPRPPSRTLSASIRDWKASLTSSTRSTLGQPRSRPESADLLRARTGDLPSRPTSPFERFLARTVGQDPSPSPKPQRNGSWLRRRPDTSLARTWSVGATPTRTPIHDSLGTPTRLLDEPARPIPVRAARKYQHIHDAWAQQANQRGALTPDERACLLGAECLHIRDPLDDIYDICKAEFSPTKRISKLLPTPMNTATPTPRRVQVAQRVLAPTTPVVNDRDLVPVTRPKPINTPGSLMGTRRLNTGPVVVKRHAMGEITLNREDTTPPGKKTTPEQSPWEYIRGAPRRASGATEAWSELTPPSPLYWGEGQVVDDGWVMAPRPEAPI